MEFLKANLDYAVFGILGFMSFLVVWFALERWFYYRRVQLTDYQFEEDLNIALTRGLTTISSIGVNAPYIGLLGTVLGILITFYDLGKSGDIDTANIMTGLAMALKATAAGLVVAIPAILVYNGLLRRVDMIVARWKNHRNA